MLFLVKPKQSNLW